MRLKLYKCGHFQARVCSCFCKKYAYKYVRRSCMLYYMICYIYYIIYNYILYFQARVCSCFCKKYSYKYVRRSRMIRNDLVQAESVDVCRVGWCNFILVCSTTP
jgi:hypothetical protein